MGFLSCRIKLFKSCKLSDLNCIFYLLALLVSAFRCHAQSLCMKNKAYNAGFVQATQNQCCFPPSDSLAQWRFTHKPRTTIAALPTKTFMPCLVTDLHIFEEKKKEKKTDILKSG